MKEYLFSVLLILLLISCRTQDRVISEPEKIVNNFFDNYKTSGPKDALTRLLASNKYITKENVTSVSNKLEQQVMEMGALQGIEKLTEVSYGGVVRLAYLVKYSQQPVRFNFTFYQPGNGWRIQNFSYETDFLDELDDLVKPGRIQSN